MLLCKVETIKQTPLQGAVLGGVNIRGYEEFSGAFLIGGKNISLQFDEGTK